MRGVLVFTSIVVLGNCDKTSEAETTSKGQCLLQVSFPNSDKGLQRVLSSVASNQTTQVESQKPSDNTRPSLKMRKPDVVEFGILVKKWYGIDFAAGTFTVDAIVASRWQDRRAIKLILGKASSARFATDDVDADMWLPDIEVTNFAHKGVDVISSSVLVQQNGTITKVKRALLTLKQGYQTADFPFDTQKVMIKVASTTYMRDELKVVPTKDASLWGCPSDLFGNTAWDLVNTDLTNRSEDDGLLKKSRGVLTITVTREASQYTSSIFIPTCVLLCMAWSLLWLPLAAPYVMPRVAVSVISILCMMSVMQKANAMIPATGATSWMEQYLEACVLLQFVLMVSNALILSMEHRNPSVADGLDNELIVAFPILTALVLLFVCRGNFSTARACIGVAMIGFIMYMLYRYRKSQMQEPEENLHDSDGKLALANARAR